MVPVGVIAAAPAYLIRSIGHPEYRAHLAERRGRLPVDLSERLGRLGRRPVWVQAVSVGEVFLARTLLTAMAVSGEPEGASPPPPFVLSSTTPAGRQAAASLTIDGLQGVFHFPIDWPPFVRRALDTVRPAAYISVETEIWPALLAECGRRGVPVLIVNGRISERSRAWYRRLGRLMREPLSAVRLACMQSEEDAARLRSVGVPADRVVVTGNMKFDAAPCLDEGADELRALFGLTPGEGPLVVAGSTSAGEEVQVLDAFEMIGVKGTTLILAPRHRERFEEVARLLAGRGIPFVRRSELPSAGPRRVILLDSIGELARVYGLADAAFVGGSLVRRGGQNLIEPAARGVPVLFGPHTENFAPVAEAMSAVGAGFRVRGARELAAALRLLLADSGLRNRAGSAGRALIEAHRGATRRTIDHIRPFLG
ncbi:MAG TPA: 3-deoxy-D-manno-octulosonic acid transferase [Candidatus Polarisedimenticolia bacterium]|jgi:3-deoxy-D-manno-octulosonic-acid transferase